MKTSSLTTYQKLKLPCYYKGEMGPFPRRRSEKKDKWQYDGKTYFRSLCGCFQQCKGKYLELDSDGTREYRKANGNCFKGCNRLEDELLKEDLLEHQYKKKEEKLKPYDLTLIGIFESPDRDDDLIHFLLMMNEKVGLMMDVERFYRDFAMIRRANPEDYKLIVLRKLIRKQHFDETRHLAAIIIDLGLNSKEALFEYFPGLDYSEFCRHQDYIFRVIDEKTPDRIKLMKEAIATLKDKQWNALKAYYITHNQRLSMQKIADKMEISKESLRDRIDGAKKKIRKYFETHASDGVPLPELMFGFSELITVSESNPSEEASQFALN